MSLQWSEWQPSGFEKEIAQAAFSGKIDDKTEAKYVLKGILKRKGLPLTTTYEEYKEKYGFDHNFFYEAYCDRLYKKINKKQQKPDDDDDNETTESSAAAAAAKAIPPPVPVVPNLITSSMAQLFETFNERKHELRKFESINGVIYRDPEASLKRDELRKQATLKMAELRKKFNIPTSIFAHHPDQQNRPPLPY